MSQPTSSQTPRNFLDAIPGDAREHAYELLVYPKTFVPSFNLTGKFPELVPKVAVILHPRRIAAPISVRSSKIGGHIYWPHAETWPTCSDHDDNPLISVMQLTKSDVPSLPFPQGKNLFQMLWCPSSEHNDETVPNSAKPYFMAPYGEG